MRHFCLPVAALARGVRQAATQARLIALPGRFNASRARHFRAASRAVTLTTVAATADQCHCAAAGA